VISKIPFSRKDQWQDPIEVDPKLPIALSPPVLKNELLGQTESFPTAVCIRDE
jgi:hypothetical protein